jgi:hypothetical protein
LFIRVKKQAPSSLDSLHGQHNNLFVTSLRSILQFVQKMERSASGLLHCHMFLFEIQFVCDLRHLIGLMDLVSPPVQVSLHEGKLEVKKSVGVSLHYEPDEQNKFTLAFANHQQNGKGICLSSDCVTGLSDQSPGSDKSWITKSFLQDCNRPCCSLAQSKDRFCK